MSSKANILSLEDLQREQFLVKERLKEKQQSLKNKMHEIPGELAAAGINSFIPRILRGKITNAAVNGSKKLINNYFAPENSDTRKLVGSAVKKVNVLSGLKSIFKLVRGR